MAKLYTRSFNGGIVSPEMFGRIDDLKYNTGLRQCLNMFVLPQGPVVSRPGTQFVREVANSGKFTRLIPFRYSSTQTCALEFSEARIRFHTFGATLMVSSNDIDAWDSGETYVPGDTATKGGRIWSCVLQTTGDDPEIPANQHGGTPSVSAVWQLRVISSASIPAGYTYVGDSLPTQVQVGQKVAVRTVSEEFVRKYDPARGEWYFEQQTVIRYNGYEGVSVVAPGGFWMDIGAADGVPKPYEISSPYAEEDLGSLTYVQSADILTICHPNYPPHELRRYGATNWTLTPITFGSVLAVPTISSVTPTTAGSPSSTQSYSYVATNVAENQLDESSPSTEVSATNQLFDTGAYNTISFPSAGRRNVYKLSGGIYGFIGQTVSTSLVDDNIAADVSRAPPQNQNPFAADWPGAVGYFEQRRVFGGTTDFPQTFWMTKTGAESNLDYAIPVRDDDAISIRMAAREASVIRHFVPVGDLLCLTDSGEWVISSTDGGSITPYSVSVKPQSYIGASFVQPVVVGTQAVYAASRGGHIRACGYSYDVNSFVSIDMSLRAPHLFDFKTIRDMAYSKGPIPVVWAISSDSRLLGMTYVPEQEVYAWHMHETTSGAFESCCVVGEGNDDALYVIVRRPVLGDLPVSSIVANGQTATITCSSEHLLQAGQEVTISGADQDQMNGVFVINNVISLTSFSITLPDAYTGSVTGSFIVRGRRNRRYVERMASRFFTDQQSYFGVDSGLTYRGSPASIISGLDHIEGHEVSIYADGAYAGRRTVEGGQIELDHPGSVVTVGIPITCLMETLPVSADIEAYAQATIKNVNKVTLRINRSGPCWIGPDLDRLAEIKVRRSEPYGSPPVLQTGEESVTVPGSWKDDGSIFVFSDLPTPLEVTAMTVDITFGG